MAAIAADTLRMSRMNAAPSLSLRSCSSIAWRPNTRQAYPRIGSWSPTRTQDVSSSATASALERHTAQFAPLRCRSHWSGLVQEAIRRSRRLLHAGLLHRHRLPTAIAAHEDARVADLAGEGETTERAGVVGDALEHGDITVDLHRETVVAHRGQLQFPARDIADVVGPGAAGPETGELDEHWTHDARPTSRIPAQAPVGTRSFA